MNEKIDIRKNKDLIEEINSTLNLYGICEIKKEATGIVVVGIKRELRKRVKNYEW